MLEEKIQNLAPSLAYGALRTSRFLVMSYNEIFWYFTARTYSSFNT